ncbi:uncharacterized protein LOC122195232 [Lactuca sativa]|uniref:uncharacterized protein LOC122195232 n=1 Tax=Lactuca sativa TaxID=4236 RepID=UPI001C690C3D|nr:uncharacterized protein LOC122195232 [Lactuca sativa]
MSGGWRSFGEGERDWINLCSVSYAHVNKLHCVVNENEEELIIQIGEQESSKGLWEAIKSRHLGADRVKEARLQTLMSDFDRSKMTELESIDSFTGKLSGIASKAAALGESIDEQRMVKKLLKSLPRAKFIHIVASLEQVLDLKTVGFEDVVGRLKACEEQIREEDDNEEDQMKALFTKSSSSRGSSNRRTQGKGTKEVNGAGGSNGTNGSSGSKYVNRVPQGGKPNKGTKSNSDRTNSNNNNQNKNKTKKDRSKIICYRCDKPGHFASQCPDQIKKLEESNFAEYDDADETVFLHETVFLNEKGDNVPIRLTRQRCVVLG